MKTKRGKIFDSLVYIISNEYNKHGRHDEWERITSKKILDKFVDILDEYNEFLLKEGYTDCDVLCEPPTAIDRFLMNLK